MSVSATRKVGTDGQVASDNSCRPGQSSPPALPPPVVVSVLDLYLYLDRQSSGARHLIAEEISTPMHPRCSIEDVCVCRSGGAPRHVPLLGPS